MDEPDDGTMTEEHPTVSRKTVPGFKAINETRSKPRQAARATKASMAKNKVAKATPEVTPKAKKGLKAAAPAKKGKGRKKGPQKKNQDEGEHMSGNIVDEEDKDEPAVGGKATIKTPAKNAAGKKKQSALLSQEADDSQHTTASDTGSATKKYRVIKEPRPPTYTYRKYHTGHYTPYDPIKRNAGPAAASKFSTFSQYDQLTLYMNPMVTTVDDIPVKGVRLDDMTVALVLDKCGQKTLSENWPAEFDAQGMIRATRVPLGYAAKTWEEEGAVDVDRNVVPVGGAGYYYKWWRGLHCLMGKEGLDANKYLIRPSYETFKCAGFGFKISSKAEIQLASGDPADKTFQKEEE